MWILTRMITSTLRLKRIGYEAVRDLKDRNERIIFALWHGRHFITYHRMPPDNMHIMVSPSRDGRRIASLLRMSGFSIIHGSSHKSPIQALIRSIKCIKEGGDFIITVDGPRGPARETKPGIIYLSRKTGAWIVPYSFSARRSIRMKSWDRFMVPLPFTRAVQIFGKPYRLSPEIEQKPISGDCRDLGWRLDRLSEAADRICSSN